jgi:hypothetical protein
MLKTSSVYGLRLMVVSWATAVKALRINPIVMNHLAKRICNSFKSSYALNFDYHYK